MGLGHDRRQDVDGEGVGYVVEVLNKNSIVSLADLDGLVEYSGCQR